MNSSLEKMAGLSALVITLMYTGLSLPSQIIKISQTGNTAGISTFMIVMLCLTFLSWTVYSSVKPKTDWFILIPNGLGFVCSTIILIQVIIL